MTRSRWYLLLAGSALAACSIDASVFLEDGEIPATSAGGGPAGPTSNASAGGETMSTSGEVASVGTTNASSGNTTSGSSSSSGMGGAPTTTTGVGGEGAATTSSVASTSVTTTGGGMMCAHDVCVPGAALDPMCDPCAAAVCQQDPFCCGAQNGTWDQICTAQVTGTCQMVTCPCDSQYGTAPDHQTCGAPDADNCDFFMATNQGQSCDDVCQAGGGECVQVVNDGQNTCDKTNQQLGCGNVGFQGVICTCTAGCGNGPPCASPQVCTNGTCQ